MAFLNDALTFVDPLASRIRLFVLDDAGDTSEDVTLTALLDAATKDADQYMAKPFLDSAGADIPIPEGVIHGVLQWIKDAFEDIERGPYSISVKTGDLSEQFGLSITERTLTFRVAIFWLPYKKFAGAVI